MSQYINTENLYQMRQIASEQKKIDADEKPFVENIKPRLPNEILKEIRGRLNPNIKLAEEKKIIVPVEISIVMDEVQATLKSYGITLFETTNIHYGRKIKVAVGEIWAEVNLFYGKKGFSVVKTPKRGSNDELADIAYKVICSVVITQ